jgi:sugar lactone lactonase YvrE
MRDHSSFNANSQALPIGGNPADGYPDGITLDSEGYMWVAFWGASCVRRLSPDGKIAQEIMVPAIQPSSVMFGGEMMDTLFITSACEGGADIQKGLNAEGAFLGGQVFQIRLSIKGREEWPANV